MSGFYKANKFSMLCSETVINAQNRTTNFADVLINEIGVDRVAL